MGDRDEAKPRSHAEDPLHLTLRRRAAAKAQMRTRTMKRACRFPRSRQVSFIAASVCVAGLSVIAHAQQVDAQGIATQATSDAAGGPQNQPFSKSSDLGFELRARAMAWRVSTGGSLTLPSSGGTPTNTATTPVELRTVGADEPVIAPMGDVRISAGNWGLTLRGAGWSTSGTGNTTSGGRAGDVLFVSGDTLEGEVDFIVFEAEGHYTLGRYEPARSEFEIEGQLDLLFGGRVTSIDATIRNIRTALALPGVQSSSADQMFIEPLVGLRGSLELAEQVDLEVQATVGGLPLGDTSSFTGDIIAAIAWRPIPNVGVLFGYRSLFLDLSDGEGSGSFELSESATAQGLFFGAVVAF
jgi:hypothetical protein